MRLVLEQEDFRKLSRSAQQELLERFAGRNGLPERGARYQKRIPLRKPVDVTEEQAKRLLHGLSEDHRRRLSLFSRKSGRVRMKEILGLTGEKDLRATTAFQRELARRLRRLIHDPDRVAQLIAWDFDSTKWDKKGTMIIDGIYYVTPRTAESLKACLKGEEARS